MEKGKWRVFIQKIACTLVFGLWVCGTVVFRIETQPPQAKSILSIKTQQRKFLYIEPLSLFQEESDQFFTCPILAFKSWKKAI
jgi:hypothetical protein